MRVALLTTLIVCSATAACADDRAVITQQEQKMSDAVAAGDVAVWDKYIDPQIVYAEEDDSYKGKADLLKEIKPLPKGLAGEIKAELLSYQEDGDTAVALFRQHETEHYYGQTIHASYLTNTVWKKRAGGWKQIQGQVIAEHTDPPSIALSAVDLKAVAGTYKLRNSDPTYTLTVADGKLMGTRTGRPASEWKAETRDVFFIPGDNRIRKIFQHGTHGAVIGFVERRESWDIVWDKVN